MSPEEEKEIRDTVAEGWAKGSVADKLLTEIDRLRESLKVAESALEKYGRHLAYCSWPECGCSCGFRKAGRQP